jgi:hypothetical protein
VVAHPPLALEVVQHPGRGARLALGLAVDALLHPPAEDDERHQRPQHHAQRNQKPGQPEDEADHDEDGGDADQGADHQRQQQLVFLALHLERLPQLFAAFSRLLLAGRFRRGLRFLGGLACCHVSQDSAQVVAALPWDSGLVGSTRAGRSGRAP